MADFTSQRQFKTREPVISVDKGVPPGVHTFELVVRDERGNQSKAVRVRVEIVRFFNPVTPITPVRPPLIDPITEIIRPPIMRIPRIP
jgi:hypothetical protein